MIRTRRKHQSKTSIGGAAVVGKVGKGGKGGKARKMHLNTHRTQGSDDAWPGFRVPPSQAQPKHVFTTCHYCGYDPGVVSADTACPKCGGHSWERNAISVRLLPKTK